MNVTELWVAIAKLLASRQAIDPATLTVCIDTDDGPVEITGLNVLGSRLVLEARDMPAVTTSDEGEMREGIREQTTQLRELAEQLEYAKADEGYVEALDDAVKLVHGIIRGLERL